MPQPLDQLVEVGRPERLRQRVEAAGQGHGLLRQRQQVQVVVAEHDHETVAHAVEVAQRLKALWAAVDDVANAPEYIAAAFELHGLKQAL